MGDCVSILNTSLGQVKLVWRGARLAAVELGPEAPLPCGEALAGEMPGGDPRAALIADLEVYFAGVRVRFEADADLSAYTPFQQDVWQAASAIPYGEVRTYGWVAERVRRPKAARAVGAALGRNPIPIVIPCHRVVGANGALTGFAYGLRWKAGLLALERTGTAGG